MKYIIEAIREYLWGYWVPFIYVEYIVCVGFIYIFFRVHFIFAYYSNVSPALPIVVKRPLFSPTRLSGIGLSRLGYTVDAGKNLVNALRG